MLELFFAFFFLLLVAAAFPFLVLFDTYHSIRTAPRAAHALARGAARNAARSTAQAPAHRATRVVAQAPVHRTTGNATRRAAHRKTRSAANVSELRAAASDTACSVAGKREEQRANPSTPGDLQRCA